MKTQIFTLLFWTILSSCAIFKRSYSQNIILWGPVLGYQGTREAHFSLGVQSEKVRSLHDPEVLKIEIKPQEKNFSWRFLPVQTPHIIKIALENLEPAKIYEVSVSLRGVALLTSFSIKTKPIYARWMVSDPPDFSFLVGSCFYLNDKPYDRPGKPYGQDSSILSIMAAIASDFNIWAGDNLYFREPDWDSFSGMKYRYEHTFSNPLLQKLLSARPNYAIWDDHDYGPNDADRSFPLKSFARQLFEDYWMNPPRPSDVEGIHNSFEYSDCAFFLLDDRWFRAPNALKDTLKPFLGDEQLNWLVESVSSTTKPYKFIICGNQVLNNIGTKECYRSYSWEFHQLFRKLRENDVKGLVFISGDRHFSEILVDSSLMNYPLYEFTCSAVLSSVHEIKNPKELNNPLRVKNSLFLQNNFTRFSITGSKNNRKLKAEYFDREGRIIWQFELPLTRLNPEY